MNAQEFERERLAFFESKGFAARSHWLEDSAGRTTYIAIGADASPTTVLVHGGLSDGTEWGPIAGRLPGRVAIGDRPGCGLTHGIDYRTVDFRTSAVDWMRTVTDGLDEQPVDVVASSMGGFFALVFALANPERVRRLVLLGAPAGLHRQLPLFLRLAGNPVLGQLLRRLKITDPEQFRKRVVAQLLAAEPDAVDRRQLELAVAAAAQPGANLGGFSMLTSVTTMKGWREDLLLIDEVAALDVPALFVWGTEDVFAPPDEGRAIAESMPDARFVAVDGAGHLPWWDRPEEVVEAVDDFLRLEA